MSVTLTEAISIDATVADGMLIGAILWLLVCCGFLADDRALALCAFRAGALRATVLRLGLAGRFFVAECLFMAKL
jgi:hypothetical protein